jgi:hypothetical protein
MASDSGTAFRGLRLFSTSFRISTGAAAVFLLARLVVSVLALRDYRLLLDQPYLPVDPILSQLGVLHRLGLAMDIGAGAILLLSGLSWLGWIYFSNRHARLVSATPLRFSAAMAVIWNLVPVAHYWMSFAVLDEIERFGRNPDQPEALSPSLPTMSAWLVVKLAILLVYARSVLEAQADSLRGLVAAAGLTAMASLAGLAAIWLINGALTHISGLQVKWTAGPDTLE